MRIIYVHTDTCSVDQIFYTILGCRVGGRYALPYRIACKQSTRIVTNLATTVNFCRHAIHEGMAEFDTATEEWQAYEGRLSPYFIANDVQDAAKQRAI